MTTVGNREEGEKLVAKALSRHIGYTSGAYDLRRIFSVLDVFREESSAYKDEIVAYLGASGEAAHAQSTTPEYRADVLSFASAMGLVEAVSTRDARVPRFAATELGRSIMGAAAIGDPEFYNFYSAQVVLRADADFLIPILTYVRDAPSMGLNDYFVAFQVTLRSRRFAWLQAAFSEPILMERIASQLPWLKRQKGAHRLYEVETPTANTARHHATPRQGWLEQLGMVDLGRRSLTDFGQDVLTALNPGDDYFWLAPADDVLDALRFASRPAGQSEDCLRFSSVAVPPTEEELESLVNDLALVMKSGFVKAKLVHASQASLQLPIEYVHFRAYRDGRAYEWEAVLDILFQRFRGQLERYSARKGKIGFYRVTVH